MFRSKIKGLEISKGDIKSAFRPSGVAMFHRCPGIVLLKEDSKTNEIAEAGTKAHSIVDKAVEKSIKEKKIFELELPIILDLEVDKKNFVQKYYENIVGIYRYDKWQVFATETYVTGNFYHYLVGGTPDFFYYQDGKLTIKDLKTGFIPQKKDACKQLMFYAACIGPELSLTEKCPVKMELHTRHGIIEEEVSYADILAFKNITLEKMLNIKFQPGDVCKECYKFSICKAGQDKAEESIKKLEKNPQALKNFKNAPIIRKYLDECEKIVVEKYNRGEEIKNFNVYETPGSKFWLSEAKKDLMKEQGMVEPKLISVREALKRGFDVKQDKHYKVVPRVMVRPKEEK